jgi:hypothetical protein
MPPRIATYDLVNSRKRIPGSAESGIDEPGSGYASD